MAGRFPFDASGHSGNNPLTNPQLRAALGLGSIEEVVILQRQQELQRDFHLRQMLLQEQMEQQTRLESMLHEQQLKAIGDQLLAHDRLRMQAEEELRRRQLLAQQHQHQHNQPQALDRLETPLPDVAVAAAAAASSPVAPTSPTPKGHAPNQSILRDIAADSLAGNAVRRSDFDRRTYAKPEHDALPPAKKRARSTHETGDRETTKRKPKKEKKPKKQEKPAVAAAKRVVPEKKKGKNMKPSALALLGFASSSTGKKSVPPTKRSEKAKSIKGATVEAHKSPSPIRLVGTLGDILEAAECEDRNDNAAKTLTDMKENVVWSESEEEVDETEEAERMMAISKGDTIQLPNFSSFLPQLPEEPELETEQTLKKRKKHKSLLDDDSVEEVATTKRKNEKPAKGSKDVKQKNPDGLTNDLLYPIDTWWPSVASIKREKKLNGERYDDDDLDENAVVLGGENQFRANLEAIKERLANDVQPGVLEKIPHCKIHRMLMQKRKNPTAPELVYCWQVTELYPNDIMVCCSHCGTWRHAACGGHCKPYSVREAIVTPFAAVCDRCQEEENILADYPIAQKRLERQRCEQIRRGLATSATMRQASFSKHGGTYKWPLGSVSATHIGGHTRSVHSRHDKAEKQWTEMATKLGRGYGYRPKERVKVRTKELERLLVSVEDAEGLTDRHNMLIFLLQDTIRCKPVGFESSRKNIFDPEEEDNEIPGPDSDDNGESSCGEDQSPNTSEPDDAEKKPFFDPTQELSESNESQTKESLDGDESQDEESPIPESCLCSRSGCRKKPRFDSAFCSDGCGVSALESDLLRTFYYASDIHPSSLRH